MSFAGALPYDAGERRGCVSRSREFLPDEEMKKLGQYVRGCLRWRPAQGAQGDEFC